jgi:hypothetical protein
MTLGLITGSAQNSSLPDTAAQAVLCTVGAAAGLAAGAILGAAKARFSQAARPQPHPSKADLNTATSEITGALIGYGAGMVAGLAVKLL